MCILAQIDFKGKASFRPLFIRQLIMHFNRIGVMNFFLSIMHFCLKIVLLKVAEGLEVLFLTKQFYMKIVTRQVLRTTLFQSDFMVFVLGEVMLCVLWLNMETLLSYNNMRVYCNISNKKCLTYWYKEFVCLTVSRYGLVMPVTECRIWQLGGVSGCFLQHKGTIVLKFYNLP